MVEQVRITAGVAKVLAALLADVEAERYGLELMRATGQPSGTLYPILLRLQAAGWLDAEWESIDPVAEGRPARRYYRLTAEGVRVARAELAALRERLRPRGAPGAIGATGGAGAVSVTAVAS